MSRLIFRNNNHILVLMVLCFMFGAAGCHKHSNSDSGGSATSPTPAPGNGTLHRVTINKTGTGSGTVTSEDGSINCGPTCSHDYQDGSAVTLWETSASGSSFYYWDGGCGETLSGCVIYPLYADTAVNAHFNVPSVDASHCTGPYVNRAGTMFVFEAGTTCEQIDFYPAGNNNNGNNNNVNVTSLSCTYSGKVVAISGDSSATFSSDCSDIDFGPPGYPILFYRR